MKQFFIGSLEKIISVFIVLLAIGVLVAGFGAMFGPMGSVLRGLVVWVFGAVYVVMMGGFLYLGIAIYENTRRTAEAVERLANR